MSRAFVKEQDGEVNETLPDLPISDHPNYVTARGLKAMRERLDALRLRRDAIKSGDSDGDLMSQQGELATLDRDIRWLSARGASAIEVDLSKQPHDRVAFGATVTVHGDDGEHRWQIVGEDEADAEHGLVSYVSPLAKALIGARVGEEVRWKRPAGDVTIDVLAIEYVLA